MTKFRITIAGLVILIVIAVVGLMLITGKNDAVNSVNSSTNKIENVAFDDTGIGVSFLYSSSLEQIKLSDADRKDKFIFRAQNKQTDSQHPVLITARYEDGIAIAAKITKQAPLDMLIANVRKSYPARYPGFEEASFAKKDYRSYDGIETVFTYKSNNIEVKQKFVIIQLSEDRFIYISLQSTATSYDLANSKYFDSVLSTLKFK